MKTKKLTVESDKSYIYAPLLFLLAALLPEYFAPVLGIVIFALVLKKRIAERSKPNFGKLGISILIYMAWMVICSSYSSSAISSLASIGLWCLMFTGYYVFTETVDSEEAVDRVFYFGCLSSGIAGFIGIAQMVLYHLCRRTGSDLAKFFNPFWRFLDFGVERLVKYLPDFIVSNMASTKFHFFLTRASGTFSNPLFFATFYASVYGVCFPLLGKFKAQMDRTCLLPYNHRRHCAFLFKRSVSLCGDRFLSLASLRRKERLKAYGSRRSRSLRHCDFCKRYFQKTPHAHQRQGYFRKHEKAGLGRSFCDA